MAAAAGGGESPDSASLYSDEIPSGYNSGEQYDTLSTGYMSGEAYELPDARLDIRGPSLDVIEEVHVAPPPPVTASSAIADDDGSTTTSSGNQVDVELADGGSTKVKLLRKKVTTFAVPIIEAHYLAAAAATGDQYDESSDAATAAPTVGGYRAVPSDTDTSALDSDANAIVSEAGGTGCSLLKQSNTSRKMRRRKRIDEEEPHDDAWFQLHDNRYWAVARSVCFWGSIVAMLGATLAACLLIAVMPRECDPELRWYHGTVALDVSPRQDDGLLDVRDLIRNKLNLYRSLGIQTLHLRHLSRKREGETRGETSSGKAISDLYHPTTRLIDLTGDALGRNSSLRDLTEALHHLNMTLMVQLPVVGGGEDDDNGSMPLALQQQVANAIKFFAERGADGVFLDGLERFGADRWIADAVSSWRSVVNRYGTTTTSRILMASRDFAHSLDLNSNERGKAALQSIDLLDATLDLDGNFTSVSTALQIAAVGERPWINWNLKTDDLTNAALSLQMLCPGTVNVKAMIDDDEKQLKSMIDLRAASVPIRMNGDYKPCHCGDDDAIKESNYFMRQPMKNVVQMERFYSRRHRYVLVANFGEEDANLAPVGRIYSGGEMVLDTGGRFPHLLNKEVTFKALSLSPGQAVVIKLPK